jgi:hypothetical protein
MNHRVRCGPTMFTKQVSGQSRSPIVAAKAQQVEPTRTKTWSQARSEVFVPYRREGRGARRTELEIVRALPAFRTDLHEPRLGGHAGRF